MLFNDTSFFGLLLSTLISWCQPLWLLNWLLLILVAFVLSFLSFRYFLREKWGEVMDISSNAKGLLQPLFAGFTPSRAQEIISVAGDITSGICVQGKLLKSSTIFLTLDSRPLLLNFNSQFGSSEYTCNELFLVRPCSSFFTPHNRPTVLNPWMPLDYTLLSWWYLWDIETRKNGSKQRLLINSKGVNHHLHLADSAIRMRMAAL